MQTQRLLGGVCNYSVFEMELSSADQLATLQDRLLAAISVQEDGVHIHVLCWNCRSKVAIIGQGTTCEDKDAYIV